MPEQQDPRDRGLASRVASATAIMVFVALGMAAVWLATTDAASQDGSAGDVRSSFPRESTVGACLHVVDVRSPDPVPAVEALEREASTHDHLFPVLQAVTIPPRSPDQGTIVALWPNGACSGCLFPSPLGGSSVIHESSSR